MKSVVETSGRMLLTAVAVATAGALSWHMWDYYMNAPWTRDGKVRADVVYLAADVSGIVSDVVVADNQSVTKGAVLFQIDQARFTFALHEAEAKMASAVSALEMARRELERYQKIGDGSVTQQKIEQARTAVELAEAAHREAEIATDRARLDLDRSTVKAPVNGLLTNFSLRPGSYVVAGAPVTALIDRDSFYVAGYFEENKLDQIKVGDNAIVGLMGSLENLTGRVVGIAAGVEDRERSDTSSALANVTPTFSWVRLAQRIPVRVKLDRVPDSVKLVAGRTVSVRIAGR